MFQFTTTEYQDISALLSYHSPSVMRENYNNVRQGSLRVNGFSNSNELRFKFRYNSGLSYELSLPHGFTKERQDSAPKLFHLICEKVFSYCYSAKQRAFVADEFSLKSSEFSSIYSSNTMARGENALKEISEIMVNELETKELSMLGAQPLFTFETVRGEFKFKISAQPFWHEIFKRYKSTELELYKLSVHSFEALQASLTIMGRRRSSSVILSRKMIERALALSPQQKQFRYISILKSVVDELNNIGGISAEIIGNSVQIILP